MIITKKALPRRTFLKSVQGMLALPLLDAMIPAATPLAKTAAGPVPRLGFVFIPMGTDHPRWMPQGGEVLGELSPILSPLEAVKDQVTVVTNLELQNSYPGTHDTSNSGFLSAAFAKHTESSDYHLGTTADQVAAKQIGQETRLASLELSVDLNPLAGACNNGYACVYQNNLSWSSPTTPSTPSPTWRWKSTKASKTSVPGACTRCWKNWSRKSATPPPNAPAKR